MTLRRRLARLEGRAGGGLVVVIGGATLPDPKPMRATAHVSGCTRRFEALPGETPGDFLDRVGSQVGKGWPTLKIDHTDACL